MRVLIVPKWYPWPDRPVFGQFCREHARALATDHDVVVLAIDAVRDPAFVAYELTDGYEDGLRTLRLRYRRPRLRPAALGFQLAGLFAGLQRLKQEGWVPDIVHAHVYSAGLAAIPLARRSRAPLVITEHFTGFSRGMVRGWDRLAAFAAFRAASVVAPVSQDLGRQLEDFGAPADRIEVVPNVVDVDAFHPAPHPVNHPPRLLTVGSLSAKKGHHDLLDALTHSPLRERAPRLQIVGAGALRAALEAQAEASGAGAEFLGELPKGEVAELMRGADLFVLPSHHENLPCVLIEAQASGLPAVATRVGGVAELVGEGTGRLCSPGDPGALAAAIAQALAERDRFDPAQMAEQAGLRYGYAAFAARWTKIYARLV